MVTCDSHHPALYLEHNLCDTFVPYENNDITILDFKNCDYESINSYWIKVNWVNILNCNVNLAVETFYLILYSCIDIYVSKKIIKPDFKFPREELKHCIMKNKKAHKKYKCTGSSLHYNEFCKLRSKFKNMSHKI